MSAASPISIIPLQLVERIEIIRGPGSAIYGEYAYAGVVNVVTRKDSQIFYQGSLHNKHTLGASWSNYQTEKPLKYALTLSAHNYAGKEVTAGPDFLKSFDSGNPARATQDAYLNSISNSPGTSNEADRIYTSTLQVSYKDYQWDSLATYQKVGDYFGYSNALPPKVQPLRTIVTASSDLDKSFTISDNFSAIASVGGRAYALRSDLHYFLPVGFPDVTAPPNVFEEGVLGSPNYTEYEVRGNLRFNYTGLNNHDLLFGVHGALIKQGNTWAEKILVASGIYVK